MAEIVTFDMRDPRELNRWMAQTIQYAIISARKDEVAPDDVRFIVQSLVAEMRSKPDSAGLPVSFPCIVKSVLARARVLTGETELGSGWLTGTAFGTGAGLSLEPDFLPNVMQWTLRTAAAVLIARGTPFNHEQLEAVVDTEIVGGVQGNRRYATRDDLDRVVRKTFFWGMDQLENCAESVS